jgi:hypothetical protein
MAGRISDERNSRHLCRDLYFHKCRRFLALPPGVDEMDLPRELEAAVSERWDFEDPTQEALVAEGESQKKATELVLEVRQRLA